MTDRLTAPEATVVVALLVAVLIWNGLWIWGFETAEKDSMKDVSAASALFILLLWFGPCVWAMSLIERLVRK